MQETLSRAKQVVQRPWLPLLGCRRSHSQAGWVSGFPDQAGPEPMTCPSLQLEEPVVFRPRCFRQSRIHLPLTITRGPQSPFVGGEGRINDPGAIAAVRISPTVRCFQAQSETPWRSTRTGQFQGCSSDTNFPHRHHCWPSLLPGRSCHVYLAIHH